MKKMINKSHIEGFLYESTIEEKIAGPTAAKPGSKYINGKISLEITEDNIVTVDIYESEYTKAGTKNQKYGTLENIITAGTVLKNGRENAIRVRIDSAVSLNDWFRPDGELVSSLRNFNGFTHIVTDNKFVPSATFEVDALITSVTDDMTKNEDGTLEPNGALVINAFIFDYANKIMPVKFLIENENGVKYFRDLESNTFTKVWGNIVTQTITSTKTEESAFGEDKIVEYSNSRKKYVVTGTNKDPYLFGDEDVLSVKQVQDAIAARELMLSDLKTKTEAARKKTDNAAPIAAANTADTKFKF